MGKGGQPHAPAASTPGKDPVPIVQEAGWAPGRVWTSAKNLVPHWDSMPGPSSPYPVVIPTELAGSSEYFVPLLISRIRTLLHVRSI